MDAAFFEIRLSPKLVHQSQVTVRLDIRFTSFNWLLTVEKHVQGAFYELAG